MPHTCVRWLLFQKQKAPSASLKSITCSTCFFTLWVATTEYDYTALLKILSLNEERCSCWFQFQYMRDRQSSAHQWSINVKKKINLHMLEFYILRARGLVGTFKCIICEWNVQTVWLTAFLSFFQFVNTIAFHNDDITPAFQRL